MIKNAFVIFSSFLIISLVIFALNKQIYISTVIEYEIRQIEMLSQLYTEFINEKVEKNPNCCIYLDESAISNFVTKELYPTQCIKLLRLSESENDSATDIYYLNVDYTKKSRILTLSLSKKDGENNGIITQKYLLRIKEDKILYEKYYGVEEQISYIH